MKDEIIRGIALDGKVRAYAVHSTSLVETLRKRHGTWPVATAAIGRTASAAAMMGAMLKGDEKVTIQVKGDGPIGEVVADANAHGKVRAYVTYPHVDLPLNNQGKLDVAGAVGRNGYVHVIKDLGLKDPYRGSIPIVSGELAEDFTYYFAKSEQTPSAVALGVLVDTDTSVKAAGGYMIQLMPGIADEEIDQIEKVLADIRPVTELLDNGLTPEAILRLVLPSLQVLDHLPLDFECQCSRDRVEVMLKQLGKDEIEDMISKDGKAEVICHFCNEHYEFNDLELKKIIEKIN